MKILQLGNSVFATSWVIAGISVRRCGCKVVASLLDNLSADPEQQYFADGMTEALISDLAQISDLKVISRTSVMRYKDSPKSLPEIAEELQVLVVLEGSVQRFGPRQESIQAQ